MIIWIATGIVALAIVVVVALFVLESEIATFLGGILLLALFIGCAATVGVQWFLGVDGGIVDLIYQAVQVSAILLIGLLAIGLTIWRKRRQKEELQEVGGWLTMDSNSTTRRDLLTYAATSFAGVGLIAAL